MALLPNFPTKKAQALQKIGALALKRDDPPQRGDPKPQQALGNWWDMGSIGKQPIL